MLVWMAVGVNGREGVEPEGVDGGTGQQMDEHGWMGCRISHVEINACKLLGIYVQIYSCVEDILHASDSDIQDVLPRGVAVGHAGAMKTSRASKSANFLLRALTAEKIRLRLHHFAAFRRCA